jgi:Stealth protein CR2, conserved region 2/Stealth protein CR1, conserved region 1
VFDVDVVITWVDGADPALKAKRDHYLTNAATPLHDNGINPHRWLCSDELNFCLRSIANNAPWVRSVWIVTDDQIPEIDRLTPEFSDKIRIVDHRTIFAGHEEVLPTFNSLSIETMLWRIPELVEHFLYFNDDVFLTAPVEIADFFSPSGPVLRGEWANYAHLPDCRESRDEASLLNHYNQIRSAEMIGYGADHIFASAHSVHPILRSVMEELFAERRAAFLDNCGHRFRCTEQFLPQSLHNHACILSDRAEIRDRHDTLHVAVGAFEKWSVEDVHNYLRSAERHLIKFLCVNDLPEVERNFPEARAWIEEAIMGR